jgi:histidinol-phosphate aminotransferase
MALASPDFRALAAPGVRSLAPYVPGKPIADLQREYGIQNAVKLASNENPLGSSPLAIAAMRRVINEQMLYPDGNGYVLRRALAEHHRLDIDRITLGNGSNDVLCMLAQAFLTPDADVIVSQYAFAIYALAAQAAGAVVQTAPSLPAQSAMPLGHDLDAMAALVTARTRLVFISNPNNPTGTWVGAKPLQDFLQRLPASTLAVVDEAYFEYAQMYGVPDVSLWLDRFPNLVVTRTFSKAYGLAGLRVGYALSHSGVADLVNRVRQPFNVNTMALEAAAAALGDQAHVARGVATAAQGIVQLKAGCALAGLRVLPSAGNFLLVDFGRPALPSYEKLLAAGIIVRPMGGYGLPNFLRITVGTATENQRLLAALPKAIG